LFGELEASLPPQLAGFVDLYRAMMFDSLGDYERLGEVTERLAQSVQQNNLPMLQPMVEGAKSRVLSETGDTGQAVELAERAFLSARTSFVGNDETLMNAFEIWRAAAYRKAGDYETARSLLTAHLARAPSNADARLELVRVEMDAGNLPRATELLQQVLQQWSGADADYVDLSKAQVLLAELQTVS
jgi:predicted Zn-dependent protease